MEKKKKSFLRNWILGFSCVLVIIIEINNQSKTRNVSPYVMNLLNIYAKVTLTENILWTSYYQICATLIYVNKHLITEKFVRRIR